MDLASSRPYHGDGGGGGGDAMPLARYGAPSPQLHYPASRWTFTQGLIVGQISMVVIALLLIRYVIFEDSATALEKERLMRLKISERRSKRHAKALLENAKRLGTTSKLAPATANGPTGGRGRRSRSSKADARATFAEILDKIGYDISTHGSESCDWLNVVLAQAVAGYREDVLAGGVSPHPPAPAAASATRSSSAAHNSTAAADSADGDLTEEKERTARDLMEEILNRSTSKAGSFLDPIRVTEADFGDAYPVFTNARVRPADDTGRMRIEVDVDYSDQITLAIDTKLLINFPKPRFAVLPVSISLTIVRFSGTLAVELFSSDPNATVLPSAAHSAYPAPSGGAGAGGSGGAAGSRQGRHPPPPPPPRSRHQLHFSLHPDFALEASASSLLGSRAKLQDIPKIEQLLISRLRGWILDRFVWPRYWSLTLPNLVPGPSAASDDDGGQTAPGQMSVETGIEGPRNDGVVEPGHAQSSRQAHQRTPGTSGAQTPAAPTPPPPPPLGSVEAWRAQTLLSGTAGSSAAAAAAAAAAMGAGARPSMTANSSSSSLLGGRPAMVGSYVSSPSLATLNGLRGGVDDPASSAAASAYGGSARALRHRSAHVDG
ncbi:uncharacterized protein PFL1_01224 [Pseudozyma flocculosa PF-1]|uniref:uncharacterized protein n=1 Tax=Pseudozyma flocculosa PF-1 TaxID=1277687 RepID=UPI0004561045|nr:uncharacterized protein PFL1_01224 [Pseudozyma flocculosa PF-1]EPQ31035.1 hypothetical protein PFL1_01224 [Pseudozyma flocculosa PF-1]